MRKLFGLAALGGLGFALAACGSSDDRSTEAEPETVERPAEEALASVNDEPVADPDAAGPPPTEAGAPETAEPQGDTEPSTQPPVETPAEGPPETSAETAQEDSE